jgi:hypothetical protein
VAPPPIPDQYTTLFSVTFPHDFYTGTSGLCSDLRASPTPATAAFMRARDLIFRNQDGGFTVSILGGSIPALAAQLRGGRTPDGGLPATLSFLLTAANPRFFNVTALALAADGSLSLRPPDGADIVELVDIPGAVVSSASAASAPGGVVALDVRGLARGLYTARAMDAGGAPITAGGFPRAVLCAPARADAVGLLDIPLTQPTPGAAGLYPVGPLFDAAAMPTTVAAPAYALPFQARSTIWSYYVISQAPGSSLLDLAIAGPGATFERQPDPQPLPNGALATLFMTKEPLPLRQTAAPRFRLTGMRRDADGFVHPVQVASLPAAPSAPVWPGADDSAGRSEMFVYV